METEFPLELAALRAKLEVEALPPGLYMLCREGRVVYVGQAERPAERIAQHRVEGKAFDAVYGLPCPPESRNLLEGYVIRALRPSLNRGRGPKTNPDAVLATFPHVAALGPVSDDEPCRNIQVTETCWASVKQRALDERVTVREVVERAVQQYLAPSSVVPRASRRDPVIEKMDEPC